MGLYGIEHCGNDGLSRAHIAPELDLREVCFVSSDRGHFKVVDGKPLLPLPVQLERVPVEAPLEPTAEEMVKPTLTYHLGALYL